MNPWKSLFKEQEPNEDENPSVAKYMSMAQTYLVKAARTQGFNPSKAQYAIDDILTIYSLVMEKKTYNSSMSNVLNKLINLLRKRWGVE